MDRASSCWNVAAIDRAGSIRSACGNPVERWTYPDEKPSMQLDPTEDQRYALMEHDPTAADN